MTEEIFREALANLGNYTGGNYSWSELFLQFFGKKKTQSIIKVLEVSTFIIYKHIKHFLKKNQNKNVVSRDTAGSAFANIHDFKSLAGIF